MGGISIWQILVVLAYLFVVFFPLAKIIRKAGYSGWWVLLGFVPLVNLVALWVFAYARWPNLPSSMREKDDI